VSLRPYLVAATLAIVLAINGYLLYKERILDPEISERHIVKRADPLVKLVYRKGQRKRNIQAYGFPKPMVKRAMERMRDIDDRWGKKLDALIDGVSDPNALAQAMCGNTNQLRPRYGAMRFLVEGTGGQRDPIRLARVTGLEVENWSQTSPISEVYAHVELIDEPKPDATLMAVAAILEGQEKDVLEDHPPWGRGLLPGSWSWSGLKKKHKGISDRVIEYFSLMHLSLERVNGAGGICREEEGDE